MADTNNASVQDEKGDFTKYFVHKVPGLYIAIDPKNDNGQTSVVRYGEKDNRIYPVWDSTWDRTPDTIRMPKYQALLTTNGPHNVLAIPAQLEQTLAVHHSPPGCQQTTIYIHPMESVDQHIPNYMRELSAPDESEEELAKPIPPSATQSGEEDARRKKLGIMVSSASERNGGDDQDKGRPFIDLSGPADPSGADSGDTSDGEYYTLPSDTSSRRRHDANQALVPFLYVHEHHSSNAKLTFGSQSTLQVIREKKKSDDLVLYLKEQDGDPLPYVEYYRFKHGYTLRFNDCGATVQKKRPKTTDSSTATTEGKKTKSKANKANKKTTGGDTSKKEPSMPQTWEVLWYKEFHVYFPPDRWNTGYHHDTWTHDYKDGYGTYDEAQAKHNIVNFPLFMDELEKRFRDEKVEEQEEKAGKSKRKGRKREKAAPKPELEDGEGGKVQIFRRRKEGEVLVPDISVRVTREEEERIMQERAGEGVIDDGDGVAEEGVKQAVGKGRDEGVEEGDDLMETEMVME
ncbi:uncharacterized protein J4E84_010392 [Alternaria hordeiaustralica]|uniref:uncharacterized protein n=1 Tax=Alternaria hordeiaustralica TaxID=1187925 RepID=UPI0020C3C057|nr:uncharacterized protein J4E84_010392 [Alternaria hordeiaustralica]KAI4674786.1 hypothetical protein J4E84_010392 [Alternaria hordeiaustralica]